MVLMFFKILTPVLAAVAAPAGAADPRCPAKMRPNTGVRPASRWTTRRVSPATGMARPRGSPAFRQGGQITPVSFPPTNCGDKTFVVTSFICTGKETLKTALDIIPSATA